MIQNEKDIEKPLMDQEPGLKDFYNNYDKLAVTPLDKDRYQKFLGTLSEEEKKLFNKIAESNLASKYLLSSMEINLGDTNNLMEKLEILALKLKKSEKK